VKHLATCKTEYKNDDSCNVHLVLGKADFPADQILANFQTFMEALNAAKPAGLKKEYIATISLNATMGPGIKVKI
jgi:large subunit ribosomal protein L1